jgi:hypothetical protein
LLGALWLKASAGLTPKRSRRSPTAGLAHRWC